MDFAKLLKKLPFHLVYPLLQMLILDLEKEKCALKLSGIISKMEHLVYILKIRFSLKDVAIWMERLWSLLKILLKKYQ
jgi:hypothetical protein